MPADDADVAALTAAVRRLEADPAMRKGRLIEAVIRDPAVDWDRLFRRWRPRLRGRHRTRLRWRRLLVAGLLRRAFPRGGGGGRRRKAGRGAGDDPPPELAAFAAADVWGRFRRRFPVLSVYGVAWTPCDATAGAVGDEGWDALWRRDRRRPPTVREIGVALGWPPDLLDVAVVAPLAQRLWPRKPWRRWVAPGGLVRRRTAVAYLRRAACLAHGFLRRGTLPLASVWEAILLPGRGGATKKTRAPSKVSKSNHHHGAEKGVTEETRGRRRRRLCKAAHQAEADGQGQEEGQGGPQAEVEEGGLAIVRHHRAGLVPHV